MGRLGRWCVSLVGAAVSTSAAAGGAMAAPAYDAARSGPVIFPVPGWTDPYDAAFLPNGDVIVLGAEGPLLQRVDLRGRLSSMRVRSRDRSDFEPHSLAIGPDGAVLFSERGRVLRRAPDGTITTVAGRVRRGLASGDGGPAVGAGMAPTGLAALADGSLLIADRRSHRVRRVDGAGHISTVAGTGAPGYGGDGGPATAARLTAPFALSAFADGSYLIAHGRRHTRVRLVDSLGRISTVAGGGLRALKRACSSSSEVPARSVRIAGASLRDVAALPGGGFAMSAWSGTFRVGANGRLKRLTCDGGAEWSAPSEQARAVYAAGRRPADARIDGDAAIAAADDGTIVVMPFIARYLIASEGSRRLAVAISPRALAAVHRGRVIVHSTAGASAVLRVFRRGSRILRWRTRLSAGSTVVRLPRRLGPGVHTLEVTATAPGGRRANDGLRFFGRPQLGLRHGRRIIHNGFADHFVGEGTANWRTSRCRHRGARVVQCHVTGDYDPRPRFSQVAAAVIRRDGVLVYRGRWLDDGRRWAIVIGP